jgi:hypothetical protein
MTEAPDPTRRDAHEEFPTSSPIIGFLRRARRVMTTGTTQAGTPDDVEHRLEGAPRNRDPVVASRQPTKVSDVAIW